MSWNNTQTTVTHDKRAGIIVLFYLLIMSVQIIAIDGMGIGFFRAALMACSPLFLFPYLTRIRADKTLFVASAYMCCIICTSLLAFDHIVWPRIIYRFFYLQTFIVITQLINIGRLQPILFFSFIKYLIISYAVVLIVQQGAAALGLLNLKIINMSPSINGAEFLKCNSLAIEPSHSARILTILFYGYIRISEIANNNILSIKSLFTEHKFVSYAFLYSMLSMSSATAIVGILIICIYLFRKINSTSIIFLFIGLLLLQSDFEQVSRVRNIIESLSSNDVAGEMLRKESSGSIRIMGIVNTFTNLDLSTKAAWIGQGTSYDNSINNLLAGKTMIGDITSYGLITYIVSLALLGCCVRRVFSIETLIFVSLLSAGIGSNYYIWCALIVFYIIKYFEDNERYSVSYKKGF